MKNKENIKYIFIINSILFGLLLLYVKFSDVAILNKKMLNNLKYTIGIVSSNQYFNKGAGRGYDYQFYTQKGLMTGHDDGNLVRFRKFLVVYDSVNIKNGFLILDSYDVTDSLKNKNIDETKGWSIDKLPFAFDKRKLDEDVQDIVLSKTNNTK